MDYLLFVLTGPGNELDILQISLRSILIFIFALVLIRVGKKRFLGRSTAFDIVLSVILGSVLSRSVNGSAQFLETLAASTTIVLLHWLMSFILVHSKKFANLIEGIPRQLISGGKIDHQVLKKSHLRESDLIESARIQGNVSDLNKIKESFLETSGQISVVIKSTES
jgi:uncharacterized membrane protein YcaP (DUF421 family)